MPRQADAQPRDAPPREPAPPRDARSQAMKRAQGEERPDTGPPGVWKDRVHTPSRYTVSRAGYVSRGNPPPQPASAVLHPGGERLAFEFENDGQRHVAHARGTASSDVRRTPHY
jgi:hypothetical protein